MWADASDRSIENRDLRENDCAWSLSTEWEQCPKASEAKGARWWSIFWGRVVGDRRSHQIVITGVRVWINIRAYRKKVHFSFGILATDDSRHARFLERLAEAVDRKSKVHHASHKRQWQETLVAVGTLSAIASPDDFLTRNGDLKAEWWYLSGAHHDP